MRRGVLAPLAIGVAAAAGTGAYAAVDLRRAMAAFTAAYGFGVATALGAMVLAFALHLAHAKWWLVVRRPFVAAAGTLPLFIVLFVPIALSLSRIYPWQSPPNGLEEHVIRALEHQRTWNHPRLFLARAALYLLAWSALAIALRRVHARFDQGGVAAEEALASARRLAAPGLLVVGFTGTFAAFDWFMSTQPGWVSDVYGLVVLTSGASAAIAIVGVATFLAPRVGVRPDHVHAIGRLMLMSIILWAYVAFFQLLLIWLADLPREVGFFRARAAGSWAVVDAILVVGRFGLPFLLLLSRPWKRRAGVVAAIGAWLVLMTALDFAWLVLPSFGARLSWADALPFVAVGALACAYGVHLHGEPSPEPVSAKPVREALRYESP